MYRCPIPDCFWVVKTLIQHPIRTYILIQTRKNFERNPCAFGVFLYLKQQSTAATYRSFWIFIDNNDFLCYNIYMNKVLVPTSRAYEAILWASETFGSGGYTLQHTFPANMYEFKFERSEQASLFALRWMWLRLKSIGIKVNQTVIGMISAIGVLTNLVFQLHMKDVGLPKPR